MTIPHYDYCIVGIKRRQFFARFVFLSKSHVATINYQGQILKVNIDPTDTSIYGYDWDIRYAIWRKFHEKSEEDQAAARLMEKDGHNLK